MDDEVRGIREVGRADLVFPQAKERHRIGDVERAAVEDVQADRGRRRRTSLTGEQRDQECGERRSHA